MRIEEPRDLNLFDPTDISKIQIIRKNMHSPSNTDKKNHGDQDC